ncbi:hypothetical protein [Leptospira interrogans]|uniref:Uncharacterized protein n=1 Tax=Leptospira interrogans str. UI 12621 TaxID=1049937 RepID=A0A0F6H6W9_LEPIR|nr:hypothetical protein [Leptospira interrogans]EMN70338.1 hypothetical protein LEP1GSC100_1453 [Leptospira interrogans serovar Bataviae str. UI 08561]EKO23975.1 hypothetical protein LEP1GSC104_2128 [Leptospira interrogans str. UI 12621]EMN52317.1 hypothetical protein LEP1GSC089_0994 [Leptospira interrogans serovar Autumnalis str. LP101]EMN81275.1 hypothetical protein LEP1GSC106_2564 [Leptospira interrogans serovar Grippotyphosa str. UI 12764]EMO01217.1 hypothetical protein LEP1GSC112_0387 [Le
MQKLNLIYLLLGLCFFSVNCLYSVKPNYTIERFEASIKPKASIWTQETTGNKFITKNDSYGLSKYIDLADLHLLNVRLRSGSVEKEDNYGSIGLVTFCILIPCRKSQESIVILDYYVNGTHKKREEYSEDKKLWMWFPLFIYNLATLRFKEEEKFKSSGGSILMNIGPNIANTLSKLETESNKELAITFEQENSAWERVNKNSLEEIIEFNRKTPPGKIKDKANEFLVNLLDRKVQIYLENRYPFIKPYLMNDLIGSNGSKFEYKFYQIFRSSILGKNPETGFKVETNLSQKDEKIVWRIEGTKEILFFYFSPYKKNITLEKIVHAKNGFEETIDSEEAYLVGKGLFGQKGVFDTYSDYPTYEYTDIEFLEKVK